jgi:hypothetical protein
VSSFAAPSFAGCARGDNSLPGSIGPGQSDDSRSYTIDGTAILTVSGASTASGDAVDLRVTFPGFCRQRSGPTISCTVTAGDEVVNAVIFNPSNYQVTYRWVCTSQ